MAQVQSEMIMIGQSVVDRILPDPKDVPMEHVDPSTRKPIIESVLICVLLSSAFSNLAAGREVVKRYKEVLEYSVGEQSDLLSDFGDKVRRGDNSPYLQERYRTSDANLRFRNAMLDLIGNSRVISWFRSQSDLEYLAEELSIQAALILYDKESNTREDYDNALSELEKSVDFYFN